MGYAGYLADLEYTEHVKTCSPRLCAGGWGSGPWSCAEGGAHAMPFRRRACNPSEWPFLTARSPPAAAAGAERQLLDQWISAGRRQGVRPHQLISWVRRKAGADIVIWRRKADGTLGCATPCIFCKRELERFDLRVHCSQQTGRWFSGRLEGEGAPRSQPTTGQYQFLFGVSPKGKHLLQQEQRSSQGGQHAHQAQHAHGHARGRPAHPHGHAAAAAAGGHTRGATAPRAVKGEATGCAAAALHPGHRQRKGSPAAAATGQPAPAKAQPGQGR